MTRLCLVIGMGLVGLSFTDEVPADEALCPDLLAAMDLVSQIHTEELDPDKRTRSAAANDILGDLFEARCTTGGGTDACGSTLPIASVSVPSNPGTANELIDGSLASTSFWSNCDAPWLELRLQPARELRCVEVAPRIDQSYPLKVLVDGVQAGQFTAAAKPTITLQRFVLAAPAVGTTVRMEGTKRCWKLHEVRLLGQ